MLVEERGKSSAIEMLLLLKIRAYNRKKDDRLQQKISLLERNLVNNYREETELSNDLLHLYDC